MKKKLLSNLGAVIALLFALTLVPENQVKATTIKNGDGNINQSSQEGITLEQAKAIQLLKSETSAVDRTFIINNGILISEKTMHGEKVDAQAEAADDVETLGDDGVFQRNNLCWPRGSP